MKLLNCASAVGARHAVPLRLSPNVLSYSLCRYHRKHATGAWTSRSQKMALIGARRKAAGEFSRVEQFFHVDTCVVAHALEEIDQVFRCQVSARSRAVGAAAKAGGAGVIFAHACFEPGKRIGKAAAVGVVEMEDDFIGLHF